LLGLGGKPWVLAIDRTNWDFGKTTINILLQKYFHDQNEQY